MTGEQVSSNVVGINMLPALAHNLPNEWSDQAVINATVSAINALPADQRREAMAALLEMVNVQNS
jgi:hypothetical protein